MLTILAAIFVFGVLVTVHELGHFIAAKLCKMRVEEFAIGFGPVIFQTKDGDTEYSLRAIPCTRVAITRFQVWTLMIL